MAVMVGPEMIPQEAWEALCKIFNKHELTWLMAAARERNVPGLEIVRQAVLDDLHR